MGTLKKKSQLKKERKKILPFQEKLYNNSPVILLTMATERDQEIIDFIDQGNYTYAQSLITKKLAKSPQKLFYHVLQNEIHLKSGQRELAIKKNLELLNRYPNDPLTIEKLSDFFSKMEMEKESSLVYENAIKKYPVSTETLCLSWFDNSIEKYDFKVFNRIFMYLNKNGKSRLHTLWYAFSFHLLLQEGETDKASLYNSLGKKLMEGLQPFENTQEIYVYTLFLSSKEIEQVLSGVTLPLDLELKLLYMKAMKENASFEALHAYTEKLLFKEKFDDFDTWKLWILSGKEIGKSFEELDQKLTLPTRNISLLKIELDILYSRNIETSVENYYQKFNTKLCCYADLSQYELPTSFIGSLKNSTSEENLITVVNNRKFVNQTDNWDVYERFSTKEGAEYDSNPVNELTLRTIVSDLDSSPQNTIKNIVLLKHLLEQDKYNYKLKLWLMKLYSQLNTNDLIFPIYNGLKIRMTQHETLNYYLTTTNPSKINLDGWVDIYRFYLTSKQEIKESIIQGFDNGVFNKLEGFINFSKRMQNSISLNFTVAKILQISTILGTDGYLNYFIHYLKTNEALIVSDYIDNRDFKSEWNGLEKIDCIDVPVNDVATKLKLLVYSIVFEDQDASRLLKVFNKITSNAKFSVFDNLLYKLYFNLLKITKTKLNPQETQSLYNYLQKNLKTDKLKILIPENLLSGELTQNLTNLVEFIKIVKLLAKRHPSSYMNQLVNLVKPFGKEFKNLKLVQMQHEIIDSMDFEPPISVDISQTKLEIKSSIEDCVVALLNSL